MRQSIRYQVDIPIELILRNDPGGHRERVKDVSIGGLCVTMGLCPTLGSQMLVRIPYLDPPFETRVEVVWCLEKGGYFDVGLRLLNPDEAFQVRMVEQLCHIEHYRKEVLESEDRRLTSQEAAAEWISKYSSSFPDLEHEHRSVRRFIRHPTDVRIESTLLEDGHTYVTDAHDIGLGGLRMALPLCPQLGSAIGVRVLYVEPPFAASGRVVWCRPREGRCDVGIELIAWKKTEWLRAVEQICEIEDYRRQFEQQNACKLSIEQAAEQWHAQHART
jgi:hypothetical protein